MLLHNPTTNQPTEIFGYRQDNPRPNVLSVNPRIMTQRKHPNVLLQSSLNAVSFAIKFHCLIYSISAHYMQLRRRKQRIFM